MKSLYLILCACLLSPLQFSAGADEKSKSKAPAYTFEFKAAKQRTSRDKKGDTTNELWNYKIEVENRSLQDVGELDVKYTLYVSTETQTGGSRRETTRNISGTASLDAIARGNSSSFQTKTSQLKQSKKVERIKSKNKRGSGSNNKKRPVQTKVTEVREKLDGIRVQLFLKGKKVGEYQLGEAAKKGKGR